MADPKDFDWVEREISKRVKRRQGWRVESLRPIIGRKISVFVPGEEQPRDVFLKVSDESPREQILRDACRKLKL
jgi:hypothetical protein